MKTPTLRRYLGVLAVSALVVTGCSDADPATDPTSDAPPDTTATGSEAPAPTGSEAPATSGSAAPSAAAPGDGYDWGDVNRRRAVSMAINKQEIVDIIFQGTRAVGDDWWPPTFAGYRGGDWCQNMVFNPEEAKTLWDEAGGNAGPITFWFNSGSGHEAWIEAVANQLKINLGIEEVQFEGLLFGDYLDKLDQGEVDGPFRLGWLMDYPSPGNFLGPLHSTAGSSNHTGYSNPDFDAAVAAGNALPVAEAIPDYQAAGDILCEDMPVIPMFFGLFQAVYSEGVDNVSFDPFTALNVAEVTDTAGDGVVSVYVCEPQNALFGQMTNETCGSEVVNGLFTGLASLDKESFEIVYDAMAESIETSDDGTNWTITLKDGWTFHDGTPVTAQSFLDAWNWGAYAPNAAANSYFFSLPGFLGYEDVSVCGTRDKTEADLAEDETVDDLVDAEGAPVQVDDCENQPPPAETITGITAPDETTIEIALAAPFPQLPLVLLYNAFNPLPDSFYTAADAGPDALNAWGEAPVGNGPFMIPEGGGWEHDVQVETVAYPDYAGEAPKVPAITYSIYAEDTTGYNDIRSGALDVMDQVPVTEALSAPQEFGDRYIEEATSSFNYLGFPIDLELAASWHK